MSTLKQPIDRPLSVLAVAACPFPWPRGTPIRIQRIAEALTNLGHQVDVATYHLGGSNEYLPFGIRRTADVFYYRRVSPGPSLTKLLVLNPMLLRLVLKAGRSKQYDLIHAHHIEGLMIALAARVMGLKLPIIYDAHTLLGTELQDYSPKIFARLARHIGSFFDRFFSKRAGHIIAVTETIKASMVADNRLLAERISVISNGIEDDFIARAEQAAAKMPANGKSDGPVFMFTGNAAPYQGITSMLEAFALTLKRFPNAHLYLLGIDSFDAYQPEIDALGVTHRVSFETVTLEHLPARLVTADVLLNPRIDCPGIPQKLLNYMASGRPVVSFAGSAKIIRDQIEGLVIENGDIEGFARAMCDLADNPRLAEKLSSAAKERLLAQHRWHSVANQAIDVYRQSLNCYG